MTGAGLERNKTIEALQMGENEMDAKGCAVLCEMLGKNSVLTNIDLRFNPIGVPHRIALFLWFGPSFFLR